MADPFFISVTAALATLRDLAGRQVTYRRCRPAGTVSLAAIVGKTDLESANPYGVVEQYETRDYLIVAADLVLNGSATEPKAGDTILDGGDTFEVMSPGGQMPAWRFTDAGRTQFRVHTKLVAEASS